MRNVFIKTIITSILLCTAVDCFADGSKLPASEKDPEFYANKWLVITKTENRADACTCEDGVILNTDYYQNLKNGLFVCCSFVASNMMEAKSHLVKIKEARKDAYIKNSGGFDGTEDENSDLIYFESIKESENLMNIANTWIIATTKRKEGGIFSEDQFCPFIKKANFPELRNTKEKLYAFKMTRCREKKHVEKTFNTAVNGLALNYEFLEPITRDDTILWTGPYMSDKAYIGQYDKTDICLEISQNMIIALRSKMNKSLDEYGYELVSYSVYFQLLAKNKNTKETRNIISTDYPLDIVDRWTLGYPEYKFYRLSEKELLFRVIIPLNSEVGNHVTHDWNYLVVISPEGKIIHEVAIDGQIEEIIEYNGKSNLSFKHIVDDLDPDKQYIKVWENSQFAKKGMNGNGK